MRVSFRDPDGFVFLSGQQVFRCVYKRAATELLAFLETPFATSELAAARIAGLTIVPRSSLLEQSRFSGPLPPGALLVEHRPIPFPNFPFEWPSEMLKAAAQLTLHLARGALPHGFRLKDATPYNIMFDGSKAVFLDVLSFERRSTLDPLWRPHAQFVQTFVYPLLANRYLGLEIAELLLTHRDGLGPARMRRLCSWTLLLRPVFISQVLLPELVGKMARSKTSSDFARDVKVRDAGEIQFLLDRVFRRAERVLGKLPRTKATEITSYRSNARYSAQESARKEDAMLTALAAAKPRSVLDIGCNTGQFSLLAAKCGARVVAIDRDESAVGELWQSAASHKADILPLVIDISRPPGASGWANREHPAFLDRARGRFDCVLMLALVHHLLVNERVPLDEIFSLLAELTTRTAIIEYVDPADEQFQRILRGREDLYRELTPASFAAHAQRRFRLVLEYDVTPTRKIYVLEKIEY